MDKRVWILGAGASISHAKGDFPSITDFFKYAKKQKITMSSERTVKPDYEDIHTYILATIGKSIIRLDHNIDIEQLLTLIEIDKEKNDTGYIRSLSEKTINLIRSVISNSQKNADVSGDYHRFRKQIKVSDTVITFNWDTLLDDAFGRKNILRQRLMWKDKNQYVKFITQLSAWKETTIDHMAIYPPYKTTNHSEGFLLKLHGSVDWFQCKNINCRAYNRAFPLIDFEVTHYCAECFSPVVPIIIPPVLYKNYNEHLMIQTLWNAAESEISSADELLIWGYSLPPTDIHANWLLRQIDYTIKAVTIINPSIIRKSESTTYNNIYLRHIFSPIEHKLDNSEIYLYEDIDDYLNNVTVEEKYSLKKYNL